MIKFKVVLSFFMAFVMALYSIPFAMASENDAQYYKSYKDVLDYYYNVASGTISPGYNSIDNSDILYQNKGYINSFGYMFLDYDRDGVKELFIGNPYGADHWWDNSLIYAMFTIKNGSAKKVFSSWTRASTHYCGDGIVFYTASEGVSYGVYSLKEFSDGNLKGVDVVERQFSGSSETYRHNSDKISNSKFNELTKEFQKMTKHMDLIPLAQYPENSKNATEEDKEIVVPNVLVLGDSDFNGVVNVKDATRIQKQVAGMVTYTAEEMYRVSDSDQNGEINVKDATLIQKFIANLLVSTPIGETIQIY